MKSVKRIVAIPLFLVIIFSIWGIFIGGFNANNINPFLEKPVQASNLVMNNSLPDAIKPLFKDYTMTALTDEYNSLDKLEAFKATLDNIDNYQEYLDRAQMVIQGEVLYNKEREFSTIDGRAKLLEQYGDVSNYSKNVLKTNYYTSDLMVTGLYGLTGQTITIFVEADNTTYLPKVIFTQNHGYWQGEWRVERTLKRGINTFVYPKIVSDKSVISKDEVQGGAIYLKNPYDSNSQNGDVSIYIEGGGFYPTYQLGDDQEKFLGILEEYELMRRKNPTEMLDMAELLPDNALFTTKSSVLYETYIEKKIIDPAENLTLWSNYFKQTFEFNGIALSSESHNSNYSEINKHIRINLRWMTPLAASGAYAYSYHIGIYVQNYWLANYYENIRHVNPNSILNPKEYFDIGHEIGHVLDVTPRTMAETTNNVNATFAYLEILKNVATSFQPFSKTFNNLASDYTLNYSAFDEGRILYTSADYDHNYLIWWYLESIYPNYWADLNNMYRANGYPLSNKEESLIYYSSLITKRNLTEYFERWGFYMNKTSKVRFEYAKSSEEFKTKMQEAINQGLIDDNAYNHLWYVDNSEYEFTHKNNQIVDQTYQGSTPEIVSIKQNDTNRTISIYNQEKDPNLLGYEVLSSVDDINYKIAGFTYTTSFVDTNHYNTAPFYKVRAVNRFFNVSLDSKTVQKIDDEQVAGGVCRIGNNQYSSLLDAINAIKNDLEKDTTIYLLDNCSIDNMTLYKSITIAIDPTVTKDLVITNSGDSMMFNINSSFTLMGNEKARIIIDGRNVSRIYAPIYAGTGSFVARYVTFKNCLSSTFGGAIFSIGAEINLSYCQFINCTSNKNASAIYLSTNKKITIDNTEFIDNIVDIYFVQNINLTFVSIVPNIICDFSDFTTAQYINCQDFTPQTTDLTKIKFIKSSYDASIANDQIKIALCEYILTFNFDQTTIQFTIYTKEFIFGDEEIDGIDEEYYIASYQDAASGEKYFLGDMLNISENMTFIITLEKRLKLSLEYFNNQEELLLPKGAHYYLPKFDKEGREIVAWQTTSDIYFSGNIYEVLENQTLKPQYVGYYRVEFIVKGFVENYAYYKYGTTITTMSYLDEDFIGWQVDNQLISAEKAYLVTNNTTFIAHFKSDELLVDLKLAVIEFSQDFDYIYDGQLKKPPFTVKINDQILDEKFYTFIFTNNLNAGIASVTLEAVEGLSIGFITKTFIIKAHLLDENQINVIGIEDVVYHPMLTKPNFELKWLGKVLQENQDFNVTYLDDVTSAGHIRILIEFSGNFEGSLQLEYEIFKANRDNLEVLIEDWTYNKEPSTPSIVNELEKSQVTYTYSKQIDGIYSSVQPTNAGVYYLKAVVNESKNYNEKVVYKKFTIHKAQGIVEIELSNWVYGQNPSTLYIKSDTNDINYPTILYRQIIQNSFTQDLPTNAGEYEVKVILPENDNYLSCENITSFTIIKASMPSNIPSTIKVLPNSHILNDLKLPDHWHWQTPNKVIDESLKKAIVIYDDNLNYEKITFEVQLIFDKEEAPIKKNNFIVPIIITSSILLIMMGGLGYIFYQKKRHHQ